MNRVQLENAHMRVRQVVAEIDGQSIIMGPKVFKTGSLGWHGQAKVEVDGTRCQVSIVLTVIGSKPSVGPTPPSTLEKKISAIMPGEQNGTMAENAPEGPPEASPLFPVEEAMKPSRKRSKG